MTASALQLTQPARLHVAIIMDGNGRWAAARGLPRFAGHRSGVEAVRRAVEAAPRLGIGTLTLYAFSSDNWRRPEQEVRALFELLGDYLRGEVENCVAQGVRVRVIGRRDRLPWALRAAIESVEAATAKCATLELRLALDYSARDAILRAAFRLAGKREITRDEFRRALGEAVHAGAEATEVDLLIRTGGEQRLSDFLLWECAYSELAFIAKPWPEYAAADLEAAIREFHTRVRRFGALTDHDGGFGRADP